MMDVSCKELRKRAWDKLAENNNYLPALAATTLSSVFGTAGGVFTVGTMSYGMSNYFLALKRGKKTDIMQIFEGFNQYVNTLVTSLLQLLFVALWSLLFVIPGVIKTFAYSMVYYVVHDFNLTGQEALKKSEELMNGYKWKLCKLRLSFIGWIILGSVVLGVGTFLVLPYMQAAEAEFYHELLACHDIAIPDEQ